MSGEDTFLDAAGAIEAMFQTGWASATPIEWPNVRFTPTEGTPYVSVTVAEAPRSLTASLSPPPLTRYFGEVIVRVYTPEDRTGTGDTSGPGQARQLAGNAAALFRTSLGQGKQIEEGESGQITFRTPSFVPIGTEHGWYQIQVVVPYLRNAYHS
jgi:hypothetical protein